MVFSTTYSTFPFSWSFTSYLHLLNLILKTFKFCLVIFFHCFVCITFFLHSDIFLCFLAHTNKNKPNLLFLKIVCHFERWSFIYQPICTIFESLLELFCWSGKIQIAVGELEKKSTMSSVAEQKEKGILSPAVTEKITGRTEVETQQQRSKKNVWGIIVKWNLSGFSL